MLKCFVIMFKNKKYLFFLFCTFLSIILFTSVFTNKAFASPSISSFLLNGTPQNVTFNPNNSESVSIEVKSNTPVKFTRLYICSESQTCNGTSGNYTKYFTQTDISDTITKSWDGKNSSGAIVSEGEYKVMVSMIEDSNPAVTEFGQYLIFVDFSNTSSTTTSSTNSTSTNENSTSTTTTSTNTPTTTVITRTVYVSVHSNPEDLSNYDERDIFQISAGRERMALVGAPLEFNAKYSLLQANQCVPNFKWSFGDGFETTGKNTEHIYKYSGEYQVVLNGICGDNNSISRTVVKVIIPEISITNTLTGDVEIKNNGKTEINLGNWKIKNEEKDFTFPEDTIISANNKIILSKEDLNLSSSTERISLMNPSDREVTYFDTKNDEQNRTSFSEATTTKVVTLSDGSNISTTEAANLIKKYQEKLALKEQKNDEIQDVKETNPTPSDNNDIVQTASALQSVDSTSSKSFWSKLIDIPIDGIKSFVRIFYDF